MPLPLIRRTLLAIVSVSLLASCSSSGGKPKPAELTPVVPLISAKQVWSAPVGGSNAALSLTAAGDRVAVAGGNGTVAVIQTTMGADVWRTSVGGVVTAGVGYDGHMAAAITERNDLVAVVNGQEVWRQRLAASSHTAPLVAGQRVFVLTADRTVAAYDGNTGIRLWTQTRSGEPLVLRHPGVLLAVGDTLVVGLGGRLVGLNPSSGSVRWDVNIASPRGGNDVERMVDLVGPAYRQGNDVCVRAFQAAVACVDASRGALIWRQNSDGRTGLSGDDRHVYGTDSTGRVQAWSRGKGEPVWTQDKLLYRSLGAPLLLGRSVVVGDSQGFMHVLSREDGSFLARLPTDGSAVLSAPVLVGDTLLALTRSGNLVAWRPQ